MLWVRLQFQKVLKAITSLQKDGVITSLLKDGVITSLLKDGVITSLLKDGVALVYSNPKFNPLTPITISKEDLPDRSMWNIT